ncbi:hypothetical protein A3K72_01965 [Candidatus Woesearchaeota archaeon RBG_13_36_6]|nr:MAG: hypothetical protein A3K72_01965 [Candidatus Woesearchaeota archaeon RBG_13_36_6]
MTKAFFADTYALIELLGGNQNYKPYLDCILITSRFNLVELYYYLLKDHGKKIADKYLELYSKIVVPITLNSIKRGMDFKLKHKKSKLSYADCVGYVIALEFGIKFLTGDNKFEGLANVEFVK